MEQSPEASVNLYFIINVESEKYKDKVKAVIAAFDDLPELVYKEVKQKKVGSRGNKKLKITTTKSQTISLQKDIKIWWKSKPSLTVTIKTEAQANPKTYPIEIDCSNIPENSGGDTKLDYWVIVKFGQPGKNEAHLKTKKTKEKDSQSKKARGDTRIANVEFRFKDGACDAFVRASVPGNHKKLKEGVKLDRQGKNVLSEIVLQKMREKQNYISLVPQNPTDKITLQNTEKREEKTWSFPPVVSFMEETNDKKMLEFVVNMGWGEEPTILQKVAVKLHITAFCNIKSGEYLVDMQIETNFLTDNNVIHLKRQAQERAPTESEPGCEKWYCESSIEAYSNGIGFFNIDGQPLMFCRFILERKLGRKVMQFDHKEAIKLRSVFKKRHIHYELTISKDYQTVEFRPGVYVTLHLAYSQCPVKSRGQKVTGNFILRSRDKSNHANSCELEKIPFSHTCSCTDGKEIIQAKTKKDKLVMFRREGLLTLSPERQLLISFETGEVPDVSDQQGSSGPAHGANTKQIEAVFKCGPAFGCMKYYCQLNPDGPPELANLVEVKFRVVSRLKKLEENQQFCVIYNKLKQLDSCLEKKTNEDETGNDGTDTGVWVKENLQLKMYRIEEELYLTGQRRLCVQRRLMTLDKEGRGTKRMLIPGDKPQEIQLLTHQPGEYLQFQIDLFPESHRVFPNMPMNQLPKDTILRYFQTALYSALPGLSRKPQFADIRDDYAKRLVPLIKQNGDYDKTDGASSPHKFHDIWGEDPESDREDEYHEPKSAVNDDEAKSKSAVRYVQQKRQKNLGNARNFTKEVHDRLNQKYHSRERTVWRHLSDHARRCDECLQSVYSKYEYYCIGLCKNYKKLKHDKYLSVLKTIAGKICGSKCNCKPDYGLIIKHSAAIVRGRLEAFLVDNTSNMLSDQFYYEWKRHTEAAGAWFVLLMAAWFRDHDNKEGFEDAIRETCRPPAFFKWRLDGAN